MKKFSKILSLVLVVAIVAAFAVVPAMAAALTEVTAGADHSITITPPDGTPDTVENTYTIYRVFDADTDGSGISYKLLSTASGAPAGFTVDDAGNVYLGTVSDTDTGAAGEITVQIGNVTKYLTPQTADLTDVQITAIKDYADKVEVGTVTTTGTTAKTVDVESYGYYYITTTSGTVVVIDSTKKNAAVTDKNTVPQVDKEITAVTEDGSISPDKNTGIAELGSTVTYTSTITVGKGAKNYIFHDTMGTGLTYNNDVTVKVGASTVDASATINTAAGGETFLNEAASGETITLKFDNDYIATLAVGTEITITYSAIVNSDALTVDTGKNTAKVTYGDSSSSESTPDSDTHVYNAKFTITKTKGDGTPLEGAGFKVYKIVPATGTPGEAGYVAEHKEYYKKDGSDVSWVADIAQGTEYSSSGSPATLTFTGLDNGEYHYTETTVPSGYNQAPDGTFTVSAAADDTTAGDTNLVQAATVVNNTGAELPSTGGIGTTIFYIVGGLLLVGAGVVLVTRRRVRA